MHTVGIDNVDYGRYPDEVLQKKWLRMYLQEAAKLRGILLYMIIYLTNDVIVTIFRRGGISYIHPWWGDSSVIQSCQQVCTGESVYSGSNDMVKGRFYKIYYFWHMQTSHLFWGVWALFQAANSTIDFNYIE